MGSRAKLNSSSFLLGAPYSTDSVFVTCDLNLDLRFVLILNYKHVRTAGLTVCMLYLREGEREILCIVAIGKRIYFVKE